MSGREYPSRPVVAVGIVLIRDGRILLVKRAHDPGKGTWAIPGGVVEDESLQEAVKREALEELGVEVVPRFPVWVSEVIQRDDEGRKRYHYVIVDFLCDLISGEPSPGDDALDLGWFDLDKPPDKLARSTKELMEILSKRILVVRNSDIREVLVGTPEGHLHKRTVFVLNDGLKIVFQEATMENVARAIVNVEMHPYREYIMLRGRKVPKKERKKGYDEYQLLEEEVDEDYVKRRISEILCE